MGKKKTNVDYLREIIEKNMEAIKLEDISKYFPENTVQYQTLNEAFRKFVKEKGPLQAERILDELNGAPYLKKSQ